MSDFKKFDNEDDAEHNKSAPDSTDAKWTHSSYIGNDSEDFRLNKLDYSFRKNPIMSTIWTIFPHVKLVSLTTGYIMLIILFYILEMIMKAGGNRWSCVLYGFGSNYTPAIQRGQIQRLIMPGFLHNDLCHLLWNIFAMLSIGSNCEFYLGTLPHFAMIGGSVFLGNCFTAGFRLNAKTQSVGGSVVVMAVLAFELAWMYFNFKKMGKSKWLYALWVGTILGTTVLALFVPGAVNEFSGHLGAFLAGICITGFFYYEIIKYRQMDLGKFAFPAIYAIFAFIAIVSIILKNTKMCYDNICQEALDWGR